jgi:predicted nicotinamide N-methyase
MAREYSRLYQSAIHEAPYYQTHPVSVAGRMVIDVGMTMAKAWINACPPGPLNFSMQGIKKCIL